MFAEKGSNEQHHESPTNTSIFSETPKHDDEISLCIASPKEPMFPETIPEEASSIEEEHVLFIRLPQGHDPHFYTADTSLLHQSHYQTPSSRRSSRSSISKDRVHDRFQTKFDFDKIEAFERRHDEQQKPKGSSSTERESVDTDPKSPQYQKDQKGFPKQGWEKFYHQFHSIKIIKFSVTMTPLLRLFSTLPFSDVFLYRIGKKKAFIGVFITSTIGESIDAYFSHRWKSLMN